jgi:hypothetical protein
MDYKYRQLIESYIRIAQGENVTYELVHELRGLTLEEARVFILELIEATKEWEGIRVRLLTKYEGEGIYRVFLEINRSGINGDG